MGAFVLVINVEHEELNNSVRTATIRKAYDSNSILALRLTARPFSSGGAIAPGAASTS